MEEWSVVIEATDTDHSGRRWLVYHVDVLRAYHSLSKPQREAILLIGFHGYGLDMTASLLNRGRSTVYRRYIRGLEAMVNYLNGARPEYKRLG